VERQSFLDAEQEGSSNRRGRIPRDEDEEDFDADALLRGRRGSAHAAEARSEDT
jgi:hypothetical protein